MCCGRDCPVGRLTLCGHGVTVSECGDSLSPDVGMRCSEIVNHHTPTPRPTKRKRRLPKEPALREWLSLRGYCCDGQVGLLQIGVSNESSQIHGFGQLASTSHLIWQV